MTENLVPPKTRKAENNDNELRRFTTKELFSNSNKLEIEHNKEIYLLQITRQGKLILTK